jgi:hypothetical protein
MASDWMVMRDTHVVLAQVGVGWDEFKRLRAVVEAANALRRLPLLGRLQGYWEDADYRPDEIATLRAELVEIGQVPALRNTDRELLDQLLGLCDLAIREGRSIEVRAD